MRLMPLLGALLLLIGYSSLALAAKLQLYTEEYRPLSYFDDGKLTGMAVEVVEQLIQRTGASASIQVVPWTQRWCSVGSRRWIN
ncbi:transporter substrate-binding domain-containing protein [Pseudomonas sp. OTU750018]|uniref:transporter substrate-binding domain-containing protein n=1 Tax=Pseudomonas sp. OTU750018 TaxID=2709708 RepID=UPI00141F1166|nr:transporter substrate-binding domain-containing protein [Pseudomonas sp. OTU750018]